MSPRIRPRFMSFWNRSTTRRPLPEEVAAYDGRRRELRFGAARPARYPDDRLDRRRLAADLDVEVVGAQLEHGLTTGVHDARVDQDARDVGPLDDARLLLRVEQRREARSDARRRDEPARDAPGCGHRSCLSVYGIGSDFKNLTSSEWNRSGASRCGMWPTLSNQDQLGVRDRVRHVLRQGWVVRAVLGAADDQRLRLDVRPIVHDRVRVHHLRDPAPHHRELRPVAALRKAVVQPDEVLVVVAPGDEVPLDPSPDRLVTPRPRRDADAPRHYSCRRPPDRLRSVNRIRSRRRPA